MEIIKRMKGLWIVFISVFLAELGDKTQLATLMFAADGGFNKWGVFFASSLALILSSLIAALLGSQLINWINPKMLKIVAGIGFIGIGAFMLFDIKN